MFNRLFFRNLDYVLLTVVLGIIAFGIVIIMSATGGYFSPIAQKQLIAAVLGFVGMMVVSAVDYSKLEGLIRPFYVLGIALLLLVLVIGANVKGAQSWIHLGGFALQPSEIMKLVVIVTLANYFAKPGHQVKRLLDLVRPLLIFAIPMVLIMLQPDLGTLLVFVGILFGMLFLAGVPLRHFFLFSGLGLASMPLFWMMLKDYQKNRLLTFLDPSLDPLGAGYNVIQSKIAIGSGHIWGKGLFQGTQASLKFLPEPHTDFIFSVLGEEFGFVGGMALLLLFFVLIWRGAQIAADAKDTFGQLMSAGVVCMLLFHLILNVGGATGIMPLTGLPLPLFSSGGSSVVANMLAIGVLQSVHIRSRELLF